MATAQLVLLQAVHAGRPLQAVLLPPVPGQHIVRSHVVCFPDYYGHHARRRAHRRVPGLCPRARGSRCYHAIEVQPSWLPNELRIGTF